MTEKRKGYKNMEDQAEADRRWREKNPEHHRYLTARSTARSFIRKRATKEDLDELEILIKDRRKELR